MNETIGPNESVVAAEKEQEPDVEVKAEHVSSKEEVEAVFAQLFEGDYTETRIESDEVGLYLWDVEIPGTKPGEIIEYSYRRGVIRDLKTKKKINTISVTYYDSDGVPYNGGNAADCNEDGDWKLIDQGF